MFKKVGFLSRTSGFCIKTKNMYSENRIYKFREEV